MTASPWTGQIGYTEGEAINTFSNGAPTGDSQANGVDIGLFLGLRKRIRSLLVGIEIDYNKSNTDGDFPDPSGFTSGGLH